MEEKRYNQLLEKVQEVSAQTSLLLSNRNNEFWSPFMPLRKNFSSSENKKTPEQLLNEIFGYKSFRPLQKEIIQNVLDGRDTLAIMPTGGGKSLCYQIPALLMDGLTIVVSPLISLMQDQVTQLEAVGIDAAFLNSTLDWDTYRETVSRIRSGSVKLLYLSPESLNTEKMRDLLHSGQIQIACITIDEVHCISSWGHDFRPDYLEIASMREQFPKAVFLGLTATATKQVRKDIISQLKMDNPEILIGSFNRPNIYLEVKRKSNALEQVLEFLENHRGESGIIYCFSRRQVDQLTEQLQQHKIKALNYHAGLSDEERKNNQDAFIRDKVQVIAATVAFGMGINKPDVRFVINYDLPKSIEEYYQQIGRAGRDGLPAHALLLYSAADIHKIRFFFDEKADPENSERLLSSMVSFAEKTVCRRKMLLNYFGEQNMPSETEGNKCCDICSLHLECSDDTSANRNDVTIPCQKLLSCILRTGQFYSRTYVIEVLLGSKSQRVSDRGHDNISTYGIGKELTKTKWKELADILIATGYLERKNEYDVLTVTQKGMNALQNRSQFLLPFEMSGKTKKSSVLQKKSTFAKQFPDDMEGQRIAENLRIWRKKLAEEMNVPPYVIFGDKTMFAIAEAKPHSIQDLMQCNGIGEMKASRFGEEILRVVRM